MKKKLFRFIIPMVLVFAAYGAKAADVTEDFTVNVTFSEDSKTINVTGDIDILKNKIITAKAVYNGTEETATGTELVGFTQAQTDDGGAFSAHMPLGANAKSGWYTINVGGQFSIIGDASYFERRMYYINEDSFNNAIGEFNSAKDMTDKEAAKTEIIRIFADNPYLQHTLSATEAEYFYTFLGENGGFDTTKGVEALKGELDDVAELAKLFAKINSGAECADEIEKVGKIFGMESLTDYKAEMSRIFTAERHSANTQAEMRNLLNEVLVLAKINGASYESLTNIILTNATLLGVQTNVYSQIDPIVVNVYLTRKGFTNKTAFQNAFNNAVLNATQGGGGGGGNGGGGGKTPSNGTSPSITPTIKPDATVPQGTKDVFADLGQAEWARESILNLYAKKIVSGKSENEFCPNDFITREEFAVIAVKAFGMYDAAAVAEFTDAVSGAWYESYIASAKNAGIISGNPDGSFGIGALITREDMATILYRVAVIKNVAMDTKKADFADYDAIAPYAKEAVCALYNAKIVSGMGENTFAPKENATRAQAVRMVELLMKEVMN